MEKTEVKICPVCGRELPPKNRGRRFCDDCRANRPDEVLVKSREIKKYWYRDHKEEMREYKRKRKEMIRRGEIAESPEDEFMAEYRAEHTHSPVKVRYTFQEANQKAREEHISYGQWVAKYYSTVEVI